MGVPAFFRWLSTKYPKIVSNVVEEQPVKVGDEEIPIDITRENPNGEEFDNLYLDMNNIIHPCAHPEDGPAPANEEEMMVEIFKYIDRLVNMVRPRKLLFMAVDGVAPRAKMNQQRSRRFRSAQDAKEDEEKKAEFQKILNASGRGTSNSEPSAPKFDSNVITPGTPFMHSLSQSLKYWVAYKLNKDPGWAKLKIIISDASIPGEGEHKMMEFIRSQRRSPEHDPNTRHVIYGLDADLIMLGLATHEPHFRILREDVFFQEGKAKRCNLCNQTGHIAAECTGEVKEKQGEFDEKEKPIAKKPYVWLHVSVLREYLEVELHIPNQDFKWDLERAIDDYVFLCFFVGNDFLPHLPSLSIREEGIDTLVAVWRDNLPLLGGYVTTDGVVDLEKAQTILDGLAAQEDAIFKRRREIDLRKEASAKRRKLDQERRNGKSTGQNNPSGDGGLGRNGSRRTKKEENFENVITFSPADASSRAVREQAQDIYAHRKEIFQAQVADANVANKSAAAVLKESLLRRKSSNSHVLVTENEEENTEDTPDTPQSGPIKRKAVVLDDDEEEGTPGRTTPIPKPTSMDSNEMPPDDIKLWEDGYAARYYERKFGADPNDIEFRRKVAAAYVEGVCWVLLYYMQGCPSWTWFYPYHYAPFAADFVNMGKMKPNFEKGIPFRPYEQLMGVLPAASNHAIPEPFRILMSDPDSSIIDFYPEDFPLDLNGKKWKWQGVAILPFIDEKRLLDAMNTKYHLLSEDEVERNEPGKDLLFFSTKHPMYQDVVLNFYSKKQGAPKFKLNTHNSDGLSGKVEKIDSFLPQGPLMSPLEEYGLPSLDEDQSMSVVYDMPLSDNLHKSQLLRGVEHPARALDSRDQDMQRNRANRSGRNFGGVPLYGGRSNNDRYQNGGPSKEPINYANPFAQHLDPNFAPNQTQYRGPPIPPPPQAGGQVLPPWMAAQMGWTPPPPPNFNGGRPPMPNSNYAPPYGAPQGNNQNRGNQRQGYDYHTSNGQNSNREYSNRPGNDRGYDGQRYDDRGGNNARRGSRGYDHYRR